MRVRIAALAAVVGLVGAAAIGLAPEASADGSHWGAPAQTDGAVWD